MAEGPALSKINECYSEVPWKTVCKKDPAKATAAFSRLSVSPRKQSTSVHSRAKKEDTGAVINEGRAVTKKERAINQ
jgi:hypothetical protein